VDYPCLIPEDGVFRACILTRGSGTVVAIDGDIGGCSLNHLYEAGPHIELMFLLACNLTGMAAHAILLKDNQGDLFHVISSSSIPDHVAIG